MEKEKFAPWEIEHGHADKVELLSINQWRNKGRKVLNKARPRTTVRCKAGHLLPLFSFDQTVQRRAECWHMN